MIVLEATNWIDQQGWQQYRGQGLELDTQRTLARKLADEVRKRGGIDYTIKEADDQDRFGFGRVGIQARMSVGDKATNEQILSDREAARHEGIIEGMTLAAASLTGPWNTGWYVGLIEDLRRDWTREKTRTQFIKEP